MYVCVYLLSPNALLRPDEEQDQTLFMDGGVELEVVEKMSLIEWFANNYKEFGEYFGNYAPENYMRDLFRTI